MIHSRQNVKVDVLIRVPPSRFRSILSNIRALNGLEVEGFIDRVCRDYNYFSFLSVDIGDRNGNCYTVVKDYVPKDSVGKCTICDCEFRRSINSKTGLCYYKEFTTINYTTKIPEV